MTPAPARPGDPGIAWTAWPEAARLLLRGATFPVAFRVALVVGTITTLVNQGGVLAAGEGSLLTWVRCAVNYLVPFVVSSYGYLTGRRVFPDTHL